MNAIEQKKTCGYVDAHNEKVSCTLAPHDGPAHSMFGIPFEEGWGEPDERDSEPDLSDMTLDACASRDNDAGAIEQCVHGATSTGEPWKPPPGYATSAVRWAVVHLSWDSDNDGKVVAHETEAEARGYAALRNAEGWSAERWDVAPLVAGPPQTGSRLADEAMLLADHEELADVCEVLGTHRARGSATAAAKRLVAARKYVADVLTEVAGALCADEDSDLGSRVRTLVTELEEERAKIAGATKLAAEKAALATEMQAAAVRASVERDNAVGEFETFKSTQQIKEDVTAGLTKQLREADREIVRLRAALEAAMHREHGGLVERTRGKLRVLRAALVAAHGVVTGDARVGR